MTDTRDTPEADEGRGLYRKYDVKRLGGTSGKHDGCEYFVLDLNHDGHAMTALRAYADSCRAEFPDLACDLDRMTDGPAKEATDVKAGTVARGPHFGGLPERGVPDVSGGAATRPPKPPKPPKDREWDGS
jgi:hypothetical protein